MELRAPCHVYTAGEGANYMENRMKKLLLGTALAIGALTALATSASAYIVCDRDGDRCWHTDMRYHYPHGRYDWHSDDWYFHRHWDHDHWYDYREGRGYWRNGVWITF